MIKSKNKKYLKFISSNWVITLTSTMVGVLLGLYLNSYYEKKSLSKKKELAFEQVSIELSENQKLLEEYYRVSIKKYKELKYFITKINDNKQGVFVQKDSIDVFKNKTKSIFEFDHFVELEDTKLVKMRGDINIDIDSPLVFISLSNLTWESYKQAGFLRITDFKCLTSIEGLYEIQNGVNQLNKRWLDIFFRGQFYKDTSSREDFITEWRTLLSKQKLLLEAYGLKDEILKDCN